MKNIEIDTFNIIIETQEVISINIEILTYDS